MTGDQKRLAFALALVIGGGAYYVWDRTRSVEGMITLHSAPPDAPVFPRDPIPEPPRVAPSFVKPPLDWIPERMTACEKDEQCVGVSYACCCSLELGSVNAASGAEAQKLIAAKPACSICPAMVCPEEKTPPFQPRCVSGRCRLAH